ACAALIGTCAALIGAVAAVILACATVVLTCAALGRAGPIHIARSPVGLALLADDVVQVDRVDPDAAFGVAEVVLLAIKSRSLRRVGPALLLLLLLRRHGAVAARGLRRCGAAAEREGPVVGFELARGEDAPALQRADAASDGDVLADAEVDV